MRNIRKGCLIFAPDSNIVKNDAMGAFIPHAKAIHRQYGGDLHLVPVRKGKNKTERVGIENECRKYVLSVIADKYMYGNIYDKVVFLCHGWPDRIQFGFDLWNVTELAKDLKTITHNNSRVILFCCSVSRNEAKLKKVTKHIAENVEYYTSSSFANNLAMISRRTVIGHYTRGHTTWNPNVVIHEIKNNVTVWPQNRWLYQPKSKGWWKFRWNFRKQIRLKNYSMIFDI